MAEAAPPCRLYLALPATRSPMVERSLADHLIGDPHVAAEGISRLDRPHACIPPGQTISDR